MKNRIMPVGMACLMLICVLAGCGEAVEPAYPELVNLLSGSPGYEGNREVRGLPDGSYLIRHEKEQAHQEKDPAGKIRIWHDEDWYAVDSGGVITSIASSTSDIPKHVDNVPLSGGLDNVITGLINGEKYAVYVYGELTNGKRIGRISGDLATQCYNTVVNLKNLSTNHQVQLWEQDEDTGNKGGGFNDNNHWLVLVDTPLYWTEFPQTIVDRQDATILLRGYDYDVEIKNKYPRGWATAAPIEKEGQQYFVLTADPGFRGYITIKGK